MVIRSRVVVCVLGLGLALPARAAAPERELSLEEILRYANEHAPEVTISARRVGIAEADVVAAAPWFPADPALDIGAGGRVGGGQDGGDFAIGVSQTLELFGEAGLRRKAANVGVKASRLDVERTRFTVHQLVHRSFHNALIADDSVDAAAGAVAFAARLVEVAEAKVRAGDASSLTVRLARTALARAKEQALTAHEEQDSARLALGREAGFTDATAVKPKGALPAPHALARVELLVALADEHQPTLTALRAKLETAKARSALAERESMPKPTVGIGYSVEGAALSSTATQHIVQATLALPLPFLRGNDAERARTAAELRVIEAELDGQRRLLAAHIAEAWTRADAARARVLMFTDEILPGIGETLELLEKAFSLGELELTEVMVGREQVLAARRESLVAWRSWFEALSALEAEVGTELSPSSPHTAARGTP